MTTCPDCGGLPEDETPHEAFCRATADWRTLRDRLRAKALHATWGPAWYRARDVKAVALPYQRETGITLNLPDCDIFAQFAWLESLGDPPSWL